MHAAMGGLPSLKLFQALIRTMVVFAAMVLFAPATVSAHEGHAHARGAVSVAAEKSADLAAPGDLALGAFEWVSSRDLNAAISPVSDVGLPCAGGCCQAGGCCPAAIALNVPAIEAPDPGRSRRMTTTATAPSVIPGAILEPPTPLV